MTQTPLTVPPDPWKRAPKTISGWGYAALVLLSVAATAASLFNGNIPALVITLVVMFGFFVALFALDKVTRATRGFWGTFGRVLSIVVVGAITLLFVETLVYIGTSYPAWLDIWFRPGYRVDPPQNMQLRPGASNALPSIRGRGLAFDRGSLPKRLPMIPARYQRGTACQMGGKRPVGTSPEQTSSITVGWSTNVQPGTTVEVSLRRKGESGEFPAPVARLPAEQGTAHITGLKAGTVYEVKLANVLHSRTSEATSDSVATDADLTPQGRLLTGTDDVWDGGYGQWTAYYTGALNKDGKPQSDHGSIVFETWGDEAAYGNPACWIYEGAFRNGRPEGSGEVSTMPEGCEGVQCGSSCKGTFQAGEILTADCTLSLRFVSYPESGGRQILYGGPNRYIGAVKGARDNISAALGPFSVQFSGKGTLFASDKGVPGSVVDPYADTYGGAWENGKLKEGQKLMNGKLSSIGNAKDSIDAVSTKCILQATTKRNGNVAGPGVLASCVSLQVGDFVRREGPFSGYEIDAVDGMITTKWLEKGKTVSQKITSLQGAGTCMTEETFGLIEQPKQNDVEWTLDCVLQKDTCRLAAPSSGIDFTIRRRADDVPAVDVRTADDPKADTQLSIDGQPADMPFLKSDNNVAGYYLIARLCAGKTVENRSLSRSVSLDQFCRLSAVGFARMYGCKLR